MVEDNIVKKCRLWAWACSGTLWEVPCWHVGKWWVTGLDRSPVGS